MSELEELKEKVEAMESLLTQVILKQTQDSLFSLQTSKKAGEVLENHKAKLSEGSGDIDNLLKVCKNLDTRLRYVEDFLRSKFQNF